VGKSQPDLLVIDENSRKQPLTITSDVTWWTVSEVRVEESDDPQRRKRSGSFGSNFRRFFSPSKSSSATTARRGGSLNKPLPSTQADVSRESSLPVAGATKDTLSPYGPQTGSSTGAQLLDTGYQRPARQSTPVPSFRDSSSTPQSAR